MKPVSPIKAFLHWYQNLPVPNKETIAFVMMAHTPIFGGVKPFSFELDMMVKEFESKIESYDHDIYTNVGVSLILRQNVEFFVMAKKRSPEAWEKLAYITSEIRRRAKLEENKGRADRLVALVDEMEERQPFSKKQWLKSVTEWDLLLANQLSLSYLEYWHDHSLTNPPMTT